MLETKSKMLAEVVEDSIPIDGFVDDCGILGEVDDSNPFGCSVDDCRILDKVDKIGNIVVVDGLTLEPSG